MKISLLFYFLIIFVLNSYSQTPSFSVNFRLEEIMYHGDTCDSKYTVILEQCKFKESDINYRQDTSKIDWKNLIEEQYGKLNCKILHTVTNESYVTKFDFRNHDYVFENLIKINIFREKCGKNDTMMISFPIQISSFVTMVNLGTVYFKHGIYDLTGSMNYEKEDNHLIIKPEKNILPK